MRSSLSDAIVFLIDHDPTESERVVSMCGLMGVRAVAYETAEEFLARHRPDQPGCVISELRLRGMSGSSFLCALRREPLPMPFILLTAHADIKAIVEVLTEGAFAVLEKPCRPQRLWDHIVRAMDSDWSQRRTQALRTRIVSRLEGLSSEEKQVLELTLADLPNRTIATRLDICPRTVDHRRADILRKLGMKNLKNLIWHLGHAGWPADIETIETTATVHGVDAP